MLPALDTNYIQSEVQIRSKNLVNNKRKTAVSLTGAGQSFINLHGNIGGEIQLSTQVLCKRPNKKPVIIEIGGGIYGSNDELTAPGLNYNFVSCVKF